MAYDAQGIWHNEDANVETKLNGLLSKNTPYMQQATTQGLQFANKRGLLNSSIAAGAVDTSRINAALPIASQDSTQINQTNNNQMGIDSTEKIAGMNIASNDREKAEAAATAGEQNYASLLANITNNENIPSDYRDQLLTHISTLRDNYYNVLQQLYGINLDWASPTV